MIFLFLAILISFVLIISMATIISNQSLKEKIFKLKNEYTKISCVQVLSNLISKKLNKKTYLRNFISKTKFYNLNLIIAPVYLINCEKLGNVHLKFYAKALERINQHMNLILLDGDIIINNEKINVINLKSSELNYETLSLINQLNVNKCEHLNNKKRLELKGVYNNTITLNDINEENIDLDFFNQKAKIKVQESCKLKINLEKYPYNYILKGKSNKTTIYNIFGEKVVEVFGKFKAELIESVLFLNVANSSDLMFSFSYKTNVLEDLKLLECEIQYESYIEDIKKLKQRALCEMKHNFLNINQVISKFEFKDLFDFFKISNLRKRHLNDYIYLVKFIFGLSIKNGILTVNPFHLIKNSFTISYTLNNERFDVKFVAGSVEGVNLNHVGHKLGVREKFVYNF